MPASVPAVKCERRPQKLGHHRNIAPVEGADVATDPLREPRAESIGVHAKVESARGAQSLLLEDGQPAQHIARGGLLLGRQAGFHLPLLGGLDEPAALAGNVATVPGPVDQLREQQCRLHAGRQVDQPAMERDVPTQQRPTTDSGESCRRDAQACPSSSAVGL